MQRSPVFFEVSDWSPQGTFWGFKQEFTDPFTAIVEAEKWYVAKYETEKEST